MSIIKHPLTHIELEADKLALYPHQHPGWQILVVDGEPFTGTVNGIGTSGCRCIVSAPGARQSFRFGSGRIGIILVDPVSEPGYAFRKTFPTQVSFQEWEEWPGSHMPLRAGKEIVSTLIGHLPNKTHGDPIDVRVRKLAGFIRVKHHQKIDHDELAGLVHLSKSRMSKLFREETGSRISSFILWTRMRAALHLLLSGKARTISEGAMRTGFYDGPSFSRYAKSMLGTTPRFLKENARLIQE